MFRLNVFGSFVTILPYLETHLVIIYNWINLFLKIKRFCSEPIS